jgi:type VI secretion system protein ImpM
MENLIHTILDAPDASGALQAISQATVELDVAPNAYDANFADFLKMQTLASLEALLANAGHACSVRQAVLALGLLLQPVLTNSGANLEKSLRLPLPDDPLYRSLVASFWLDLISGFAARGDFEVGIFVTANQGGPALVVSFNGASAKTLQGLMDPAVGLEQQVSIVNSDWVEGYVEDSHAIKKLSSYMLQPQLSLYQTGVTFREVFLGA